MTNKNTFLLILFLLMVAVVLGWVKIARPFGDRFVMKPAEVVLNQPAVSPSPGITSTRELAQAVVAAPWVIGSASSSAQSTWIETNQPGLVTIFGDRLAQTAVKDALGQLSVEDRPLVVVDHEGGTVQRLSGEGFTSLPSWRELCQQTATTSAALLQQSASELAGVGVNVVLAPVVDVGNPAKVLGSRVCSGDAATVTEKAFVAAKIWQDHGILPVLKHFPGIGTTTRDLHTSFDRVSVNADQALVYQALLDRLPNIGVMTSHAGVINQYPDVPCSLSLACVSEMSQNYPQVLIFSDALEMKAAAYQPTASGSATAALTLPEIAVKAVLAGNQVLVFGPTVTTAELDEVIQRLANEAQQNATFRQKLEASYEKINRLKQQSQEGLSYEAP